MEKLKNSLLAEIKNKAKKITIPLALGASLSMIPCEINDNNFEVNQNNKAYASENISLQMYSQLSAKYPGWFLDSNLNENSANFIKKVGDTYIATDTFSKIAEYRNGEWSKLDKNEALYPDNPKKRMAENLETLKSSIFTSNENGMATKTKNPLGITSEDIEEYKNSNEKNLSNIVIISNKKNEDSLVIMKKTFSEKNIDVIKAAFEILNRDQNKLDHITIQQGLRAITTDYANTKVSGTDSLNYMIASRGVLCLNPKKIENPLDVYLSILYQSNASELWKSVEVTNGKKINYLDNSGKKLSLKKMELAKEYISGNKSLFSTEEFNYLTKEINRLINLM